MTQTDKKGTRPSRQPEVADPVSAAARDLTMSITRLESKIRKTAERAQVSLDRYKKIAADATMRADDQEYRGLINEEIADLEANIVKMDRHRAALQRKIALLAENPEEAFLPLGTVVRFVGVPEHQNSLGLTDDRKSYPVPGSIGVVTRLNRDGECSISVSMRETFRIGWGDELYPSDDRLPTYFVEREMLEVEEYAKLPDGTEYLGYGFQPTHIRTPEKDEKQGVEMVLEARGHFWRFHDFGGKQGIEALQAYEHMDAMSWIEGPLEQYGTKRPSPTSVMVP
ncbi:hypothetical protein OIU34_23260 [Pararhizobium sp. BT-229]|uniref:hypothetical protein n=1 Tax=Pararhizobium sp. BT-229 TaxID=2986923 RepID=UPI0021F76931|nr:hypothetical protein [Pararhizobium sp. BT-229]MCV9964815.1 hypothetical protein [Pararhizobium sp. BT-229]